MPMLYKRRQQSAFRASFTVARLTFCFGSRQDDVSREKAIKALVAGQQSENLLDMDDDPPTDSPATTQQSTFGSDSFSPTTSSKPAANPLDDLLGLFDNAGLGGGTVSNGNIGQNSSFGGMMDFSAPSNPTSNNSTAGRKDVDLLADLF